MYMFMGFSWFVEKLKIAFWVVGLQESRCGP